MLIIKNKTITLTRGDTLKVEIEIIDVDGHTYTPKNGDVIKFAMRKQFLINNEPAEVITKIIDNETLILSMSAAETKELDYGSYIFDIEITYANGDVDTFITGVINITEEVS